MTSQAGSYILQWKHFESTKPSFDFPLTSHKSKVMYHTELLPSAAFRYDNVSLYVFVVSFLTYVFFC